MAENYIVNSGDCVNSVAYERGFFWKTLWDHPDNRELQQKRKDPDILMEGDVLHVPEKHEREESGATEQKHKFKRRGVPAKFVMVVLQDSEDAEPAEEQGASNEWEYKAPKSKPAKRQPMGNAPFQLFADGVLVKKGQTDGNGRLEVKLPPNARDGLLLLNPGASSETHYELNFRQMDPITELAGVCKRLNNLGFPCPTDVSELTPEVQAALQAFQTAYNLKVTGQPDEAMRSKLQEVYGA